MKREENQPNRYKKNGDKMSLAQYLEKNKEKAYSFASSNTKYNTEGRPIVSKDDEWVSETEWDDLFNLLKNKKAGKNTNE